MFDSLIDPALVVSSAASSFNNAAISAPSFFWMGLLMLPLFVLVYFFGNAMLEKLNWTPKWRTVNFALAFEIIVFAWIILMSGNYAVLRDEVSNLPFVIAITLFAVTASIVQRVKTINPAVPTVLQNFKYRRPAIIITFLAIVALAGFSGEPTLWGFILQAAAVFCGAIVGRAWKNGINPVFMTTAVMFTITTAILMQPEFYRFGQLGSLTALHMLFVLLVGILAMAVLALRNVNPRGRIHNSAYIKLKWMGRIVVVLCIILFVLTESVPVFLGTCAAVLIHFAMSVWHAGSVPENLSKKIWAALLCVFGIMTVLPVITALGIMYWVALPHSAVGKQSRFLL